MKVKFFAGWLGKTITTPSIHFSWNSCCFEICISILCYYAGVFFIKKEESDE